MFYNIAFIHLYLRLCMIHYRVLPCVIAALEAKPIIKITLRKPENYYRLQLGQRGAIRPYGAKRTSTRSCKTKNDKKHYLANNCN